MDKKKMNCFLRKNNKGMNIYGKTFFNILYDR